jgi:pimeloyl-ACP methyl ester carboxylesterase
VTAMSTRIVPTNGVELRVAEAGSGPPVILAHGFPELAYSWRHQLPALAAAGLRALAPDQRGYGGSTCPAAIEDYDIMALSGDLLGLLDDIGEERAVFVGHDWGAMVAWQTALLAPQRCAGVVGMSVPFQPRGDVPPIEAMRMVFADSFFYILYFQEPGVADADLGRDPERTMRGMLAGVGSGDADADAMAADGRGFVDRLPQPAELPGWLSTEELDHYVAEFRRTGFTGGLNWYRNFDRNWRLTEHLAGAKVTVPSLFIGGSDDPVLVMSPPEAAEQWLTDHRGTVLVEGAGHWVQQEAPDQVNEALLSFIADL